MTEVVVLGTGSADGWPNPFCVCASCTALRKEGLVRGQTAALVDSVLLLDCGPEAPRAAERAGVSLHGVRHLLFTHAHPDHAAPAALLWRRWARLDRDAHPIDVVGPDAALALCRDWVGPADPVRWRPVVPGDVLELSGYVVRVLPAAHGGDSSGRAVLYDVTAPSGHRILYATDTGPLPAVAVEACRTAAFDLVLLEETWGDRAGLPDDNVEDHLELATFSAQLARLRACRAISEGTDVIAVHLSHHNPPTAELDRRLASWGARTVPDGTRLMIGDRTSRAGEPVGPSRVLLLGGARSGKSAEAERRLGAHLDVTYIATAAHVDDPEWRERVARHQARRPPNWLTVETTDLVGALAKADGPVLVDCLTLWLTALMDEHRCWDGAPVEPVRARIEEFLQALRGHTGTVVLVSNEVGSGVVPDSASGRLFRDELGRLNAAVAREVDDVMLVVAGRAVPLP